MAISVILSISDNDEQDVFIEDIGTNNIKDWIRDRRAEGGIYGEMYNGTTPYIPFQEVRSFWFHDESLEKETVGNLELVH